MSRKKIKRQGKAFIKDLDMDEYLAMKARAALLVCSVKNITLTYDELATALDLITDDDEALTHAVIEDVLTIVNDDCRSRDQPMLGSMARNDPTGEGWVYNTLDDDEIKKIEEGFNHK